MAGIRPGTLRGEDHWARYDHDHAGDPLDATSILTGVPGAIAPDDTAALGSALSLARSDHRHAFTSAVAAALTKTATAGEGAAATHARSDHVHSTAALPWGIVARHSLTANSAALSDGNTADWLLDEVAVDVTRLYRVNFIAQFVQSATGNWLQNVHADGTAIGRVHAYNTAASLNAFAAASFLWEPATGTPDLDVRVDNLVGGGTLTYEANANAPRQLWVEDIGPR